MSSRPTDAVDHSREPVTLLIASRASVDHRIHALLLSDVSELVTGNARVRHNAAVHVAVGVGEEHDVVQRDVSTGDIYMYMYMDDES